MATLILPARSNLTHYEFGVELEGASYTIELRWNARDGAWYLSLYDSAGEPLVSGHKAVLGANLLGRGENPRLPPGLLTLFDTSGTLVDPGQTELGGRVQLIYMESADLAAP
jgi:hypothetical protein